MMLRLLLLFTLVPLIELWLLLWISSQTSVVWTVGLVLLTGFVGAALARQQGWRTWQKVGRQMADGQPPTDALVDGLLILIAGALLITPGLLTDLAGFALLAPPIRAVVKRRLAARLLSRVSMQRHHFGPRDPESSAGGTADDVIDVESRPPGEA